jgi:hypothetical protein
MSKIVPTIGRIVYFKLASYQADEINRRRKHAVDSMDFHRWKKNGTMVHCGNEVKPGQVLPMVIVAVWGNTPECAINGKLFLDGSDDYWVTSVSVGTENGSYHWMPYQIGQAAKTEELKIELDTKSGVKTTTKTVTETA